MARRKKREEEHRNHEAWSIPYADLMTLLLAFFVVMYAISSVNEGKYRVLSDSLFAAFRGTPRTTEPIQVGEKDVGDGADIKTSLVQQAMLKGQPRRLLQPIPIKTGLPRPNTSGATRADPAQAQQATAAAIALKRVADKVAHAMDDLVRAHLVVVRRHTTWIEVEIRTDILFPSGSATLAPHAIKVIERLAKVLKPFPNPIHVEGDTDNVPIHTDAFPSNWELSAARAASVVHLFANRGVDPARLAVIGLSEYNPVAPNTTSAGRNANRRVDIMILSTSYTPATGAVAAASTATPAAVTTSAPAPAPGAVAVAASTVAAAPISARPSGPPQ